MATERGRSACRGLVVVALVFASCVGLVPSCKDSGGGPGQGGSGGGASAGSGGGQAGSGGSAGSGGNGGAASGGTPGFMAIAPCLNESDYVSGTTTVNFGLIDGAYKYEPKCLKLRTYYSPVGTAGAPGTDVTFSGDFTAHPLEPSARSGSQLTPITSTSSVPDGGTSKSFKFYYSEYYAYYCATHNPSDDGSAMSGVIWVEQIGWPTQ